ncbi:Hypothetical predicted protein [Octopus vulgaris]|uniref:Uncharacterized protein n=1 Tax=Octopus vulgaris TaxID=6645 RepID=A0AA36FH17_OCTVU|nr:Hypothetical predicted protein [Octopus vulgaris]
MVKVQEHSSELKKKFAFSQTAVDGYETISKNFNMARSTVRSTIVKYRDTGVLENKSEYSRKKFFSEGDDDRPLDIRSDMKRQRRCQQHMNKK